MSPGVRAPARWRAAAARRWRTARGLSLPLVAVTILLGAATPAAAEKPDDRLKHLGNEFLAHRFAHAPHLANELGAHEMAGEVMPVTQATLAEDATWLRDFRSRLASIPESVLSRNAAADYRLLAAQAERQLLEIEVIRPFERDPSAYLPLLANSVESALRRRGVSNCGKLRQAARRLARAPEVLRAARINLRQPPRELTLLAIERYMGLLAFYRETVPELAAPCGDAMTQADLAVADTAAVRAVQAFLDYLREDLLPGPSGPVAIGPEACLRLLRLELLDPAIGGTAPPAEAMDSLLAEARLQIAAWRDTLAALAGGPEPERSRDALGALTAERPEASALLAFMDRRVDLVYEFLDAHPVVSLPESEALVVRPALPVRRSLFLTWTRAAGPWEAQPPSAWFEVTPPDSSRDETRRQLHLARFNRHEADLAAIHDVAPGAFLRAVTLRDGGSRLRRALQSAWSPEAWGAYCERMMVDEGFGASDPGYRLAAAARALRYAGRSYVAMALHAGVMSAAEAVETLATECLLDPDDAAREARRAAADPAAMGYTAAARRLLELRDQARQALGPRFRIQSFNDAVLRRGAAPVGLVSGEVWRDLGLHDGGGPVGGKP